jgi:hypothetical protein
MHMMFVLHAVQYFSENKFAHLQYSKSALHFQSHICICYVVYLYSFTMKWGAHVSRVHYLPLFVAKLEY